MSNKHKPPLLARGPWWIVPLLGLLAAVAGGVTALVPDWWKAIPIGLSAGFLILNFLVQLSRKNYEDDVEATMARYIDSQLSPLMQKVAGTVAETDPQRRREHFSSVLQSVVNAASEMIGPRPVRASVFQYTEGADRMVAHPTAFAGRRDKSERVYTTESPTLHQALIGKPRFVEDAKNENLAYKTYMTHPIMAGGKLYGVLSIDSPNSKDISPDDEYLLQFLSVVAAIPYALEQAPSQPVNHRFEP
ncbi:GAF domain-containing protein [Rhodococcus aetherivorans]|uniref:GAF domain-containing protein n=1 Tax=Rhodococcus aetherivorans TaxID=191292 RepID=UPI0036713D2E